MDKTVKPKINLKNPFSIILLLFVEKRIEIFNVLTKPIGRSMYEGFADLLMIVFKGFLSREEWAEWVHTNIKLFNIHEQRKAYGIHYSFERDSCCGVQSGLPCDPSVCGTVIPQDMTPQHSTIATLQEMTPQKFLRDKQWRNTNKQILHFMYRVPIGHQMYTEIAKQMMKFFKGIGSLEECTRWVEANIDGFQVKRYREHLGIPVVVEGDIDL